MIFPSSRAALRTHRRRLRQHALAVRATNPGTDSRGADRSRTPDQHIGRADNGLAPTSSPQPLASTTAVSELYESLMSSRRRAHASLQTMRNIERQHHDMPLDDLADLAVTGALHPPAPDRDDVQQP